MLLASLALGACDFPTAPPIFETRFIIPGEATTLSVNELLPGSITVSGGAFRLTLGSVQIPARTLGQMCGAPCLALPAGTAVPKPAFTTTIPVTVDVPDDVAGATITSASVTVSLTHNFGFDPLQPAGRTSDGFVALTVRNGTRVLGVDTIRGAFPSGSTLTRSITLAPGEIAGDIDVSLALNSPAGGTAPQFWVPVNNNASLSGSVTPGEVAISQARVAVQARTVSVTAVNLDLSDIDEETAERVVSGAFVVDINNPLGVTGTMNLTITGGSAGTITKALQISTGQSRRRVEFTGAELQSILGRNVTLSISGPVSAPNGTVTVTPGQVITIDTQLDIVIAIGGSEDEG